MAVNYKRRNNLRRGPAHLVNHRIRVSEVRLIDEEGNNIGIVDTREALRRAQDADLDLVVISEKALPPVARILSYSKFLYDEKKKKSSRKQKVVKNDTKEFIFGPTIGDGDLVNRIERTREFIKEGNRVKMSVRLRGRQKSHPELGFDKLNKAIEELKDIAKPETEPKLKGSLITVTFIKQ